MFNLNLSWKSFNVSCDSIKTWLEANVETEFLGMSANSSLQIHFEQEPLQEEKDNLQVYWDALSEESDEATSYQTGEQIKAAQEADKAAKVASASAKLAALGLTAVEIQAIVG